MLWARLVSKRVYGYSGRNSYDLYNTDGVFTGALSDELGWKHSGLKSGHIQGRAYDRFSIIILLYGWFWLLSWSVLRGRALVGGGSMWWGFYPLVMWFGYVTSGHPYSPQSAYITPLSFLVLRNQSTFTL